MFTKGDLDTREEHLHPMLEAHAVEQEARKPTSSDVHLAKVILTEVLGNFFNCKQRCPWRDGMEHGVRGE